MNCPNVTLRCIKSHLYHVVFIRTCKVLSLSCSFLSLHCIHCLFPLTACTFVTCDIKYQSINQSVNQSTNQPTNQSVLSRWAFSPFWIKNSPGDDDGDTKSEGQACCYDKQNTYTTQPAVHWVVYCVTTTNILKVKRVSAFTVNSNKWR